MRSTAFMYKRINLGEYRMHETKKLLIQRQKVDFM
ncbi:hypothetical protein I3843_12G059800 [Carya illinoinensis]|nr:hypothetical protein I3843_12G059800 [Carya illinoinensis]